MTCYLFFFFFNDTATTEIYTLSLHDALPISVLGGERPAHQGVERPVEGLRGRGGEKPDPAEVDAEDGGVAAVDRKSTRLNSSHSQISYAVFCLKKKKKETDKAVRH